MAILRPASRRQTYLVLRRREDNKLLVSRTAWLLPRPQRQPPPQPPTTIPILRLPPRQAATWCCTITRWPPQQPRTNITNSRLCAPRLAAATSNTNSRTIIPRTRMPITRRQRTVPESRAATETQNSPKTMRLQASSSTSNLARSMAQVRAAHKQPRQQTPQNWTTSCRSQPAAMPRTTVAAQVQPPEQVRAAGPRRSSDALRRPITARRRRIAAPFRRARRRRRKATDQFLRVI